MQDTTNTSPLSEAGLTERELRVTGPTIPVTKELLACIIDPPAVFKSKSAKNGLVYTIRRTRHGYVAYGFGLTAKGARSNRSTAAVKLNATQLSVALQNRI